MDYRYFGYKSNIANGSSVNEYTAGTIFDRNKWKFNPLKSFGSGISVGIGGIIFDIIGEFSIDMNNSITQNVLEKVGAGKTNAYNENVAIQPMVVTIEAYVGECVVNRANEEKNIASTVLNAAQIITSLVPNFNNSVKQLKFKAKNLLNTADFALKLVENLRKVLSGDSYQEECFSYVQQLRSLQYPVTLTLPKIGNLDRMMCKSVKWIQPKETENYAKVQFVFQEWCEHSQLKVYSRSNPNVTKGSKCYCS